MLVQLFCIDTANLKVIYEQYWGSKDQHELMTPTELFSFLASMWEVR